MLFVIGIIDNESNQRLEDIRKNTERLGIPTASLYDHITFATYTGDDDSAFITSCKEILRQFEPFTIHFEKIGQLPNTLILAAFPTMDKEITAIHKSIVDTWKDSLTPWTQEGIWKPHTTLLSDIGIDLNVALEKMQEAFRPFDAEISRIKFSCVSENGFEIVDAVNLSMNS